jgi:hypothetical protein
MKTLILWTAALATGISGPAFACSPSLTSFSRVIEQADFAFFGRATVRIAEVTPISPESGGEEGVEIIKGEVKFSGIKCYVVPRGERHCPRSLIVPFEVAVDGHNCPPWILRSEPNRDRYFTLLRDEDGSWQLGGAWRRFDKN